MNTFRAKDKSGRYWHLSHSGYGDHDREHDDVVCPHGHPADLLRASDPEFGMTQQDLKEWVADHADEFTENWCRYGH